MYTSTFTFLKGEFDDTFHDMDRRIAETARRIPGYLGEEAWENQDNGLVSTVYYWESLDALRTLMDDPTHREAKREQSRWLAGYHIVVAQVIETHGDGKIPHPLSGRRAS